MLYCILSILNSSTVRSLIDKASLKKWLTNAAISSGLLVNGSSSTHEEIMDKLSEHEFSFDELTLAAASSSDYLKIKENFEKTNIFDRLSRESLVNKNNLFRVTITIFLLILFTLAGFVLFSVFITVRCHSSHRNRRPIYNTHPDSVYHSTIEPVSSQSAAEQNENVMITVPV
jgi:hypothetical protein